MAYQNTPAGPTRRAPWNIDELRAMAREILCCQPYQRQIDPYRARREGVHITENEAERNNVPDTGQTVSTRAANTSPEPLQGLE
jgi:hypothetical protein